MSLLSKFTVVAPDPGTNSRQEAHAVNTANRNAHGLARDVAVLNAFGPEGVRGGTMER